MVDAGECVVCGQDSAGEGKFHAGPGVGVSMENAGQGARVVQQKEAGRALT